MKEEYNYPIKYAVLELKEKGGWIHGYRDIIRGYIVEKCYVVESVIRNFANEDSKVFHKVVFPFKNLTAFKYALNRNSQSIGEKEVPEIIYNRVDESCIHYISNLYDSYEDAKVEALEKNKKMEDEISLYIPYDEKFLEKLEKKKQEFKEELTICNFFEKLALSNSEDMDVTFKYNEDLLLKLTKYKNK